MEMIWKLAFLAQYGALVATIVFVGALVVSVVVEVAGNKQGDRDVFGSVAGPKPAEGSAL